MSITGKRIFLIILFIFFFINIDNISAKDKDKEIKDKKDKTEKLLDKLLKDLEKADKKSLISKSKNENEINSAGNGFKKYEKENINLILNNLESIQQSIDKIKREVKQHQTLNQDNQINQLNSLLKNSIKSLNDDYNSFCINLNENQKRSVSEQTTNIDRSFNKIDRYFNDITKVNDNENYYNKTVEFEKEVRIIYRQYRAIDWILFEQ